MNALGLFRTLLIQTKYAATRRTSKKVVDSDAVLGKLARLFEPKKDPK